jgi:hypothetical protein
VKPGAIQGEGPSAAQFAAAVVRAGDELGLSVPLYMSSAPLPIGDGPVAGDHLRAEIQRYLDAGFTEIALACGDAMPPDAMNALRIGLNFVREREVSLVLSARDGAQAMALRSELARSGASPDLVSLSADVDARALDAPLELPLGASRPELRGIDVSAPIERIAARLLGERVEPARARELESVEAATVEKLEALTYAEALGVLREEPFRGAAQRVMRALSEKPGY